MHFSGPEHVWVRISFLWLLKQIAASSLRPDVVNDKSLLHLFSMQKGSLRPAVRGLREGSSLASPTLSAPRITHLTAEPLQSLLSSLSVFSMVFESHVHPFSL